MEASNTPTIRRLTPSCRHQLPRIAPVDLLIIQIDGLHIGNDLVLVTALGIDGNGDRHPLGLVERATENTAVVQALIDNLIERGLDRRSVGCSSSMAPRR